jgi:hypothetical protein
MPSGMFRLNGLLGIAALMAAGAAAPAQAAASAIPGAAIAVPVTLDAPNISVEASRLRLAMASEVPAAHLTSERQAALIALGKKMAAEGNLFIRRPQLILLVDRSTAGQVLAMTLAMPDGQWEVLGASHVSTGKPGRKEHYKTPVGVLLNDGSELGYRAQGTYNQNHIRGLGVKGMRVWDFGWQTTDDWRTPGATTEIRVEMHATDPAVLAQRIGRPDSEGCIRVPEALNKFLDRHGIIDADLEALASQDIGYRALLPAHRVPTPLAGDAVVVVDSSAPWLRPRPPAPDVALGD